MTAFSLPDLTDQTAEYTHLPTRQQLFLWRNWEMVAPERLAKVLGCQTEQVLELARLSGLPTPPRLNPLYQSRGYITLIRNNWHLLPYRQLTMLLGISAEELAFRLKEDDFLAVKLWKKPNVAPLYYRELTAEERQASLEIQRLSRRFFAKRLQNATARSFDFSDHYPARCIAPTPRPALPVALSEDWRVDCRGQSVAVRRYAADFRRQLKEAFGLSLHGTHHAVTLRVTPDPHAKPESHTIVISEEAIRITAADDTGILRALTFLLEEAAQNGAPAYRQGEHRRAPRFHSRILYSYQALFGDALLDGAKSSYPDSLLRQYAALGINGIWLHAVLYQLVPFAPEPALSAGWERRQEGLRDLIARAARYGIGVYLYLNEPRCMPRSFFETHPEMLGYYEKETGTLCTEAPAVRRLLYENVRNLCASAPGLRGFFTITASENLTNCYSHMPETPCPRCALKTPTQVIGALNTLLASAAHSVDPSMECIAWNWAWDKGNIDWPQMTKLLRKEQMPLLCTSEEGVQKNIGGVTTAVVDYALSMPGPGSYAKKIWKIAQKDGVAAYAKIQCNNSWECSAVPYLPLSGLVEGHLQRLERAGVEGLLLSWSLGGYPSMTLGLAAKHYFSDSQPVSDYYLRFGPASDAVHAAVTAFGRAMGAFPFHLRTLYRGPQQLGPANLWFAAPSGLLATMTGFPYDDLEHWRGPFPEEVLEQQFRKLSRGFRRAFNRLARALPAAPLLALQELSDVSQSATLIYESVWRQIRFIRLRNAYLAAESESRAVLRRSILRLIRQEEQGALCLLDLVLRNSAIGFEAANHYFFNRYSLMEKVLNCRDLQARFSAE